MAKPCLISEEVGNEAFRAQWFAVWTLPRYEKRVANRLADRDLECFLPVYVQERQWKKRSPEVVEMPLFPTYLFVKLARNDRGSVLSTTGVLSIIGNGKYALPVPDAEIEAIRAGLTHQSVEPHRYLELGENVRVRNGPLAGCQGLLVRAKGQCRVVLSVGLIRQSISVEVDRCDLDPIAQDC
jgi:transcription antitermination factor NusG